MAQGSVSQTIASQHEYVDPNMERLYLISAPLWKRIKSSTDVKPVSNRPVRVPFEAIAGGKLRTGNFDGGSLGRGSAPTEVFGNVSCVSYVQASEYTALSDFSTDSSDKALKNYVTLVNQRAVETFGQGMDGIATYGDGANTLDTVVGVTTGGIIVNNANKFTSNQDVDVWTAVGGTFVGTVTIQTIDSANNTIWLTGTVPAGTTAGYALLVSGSAGVANTGMFGLLYYGTPGNAGNYMGIPRSAFPGLFSTPSINLAGGALTPASVRALEAQVRLAIGTDRADEENLVAHMGVDMQAAWENNSLIVQSVIANQIKGDTAVDMLQKSPPKLIAGREIIANERATPGRIDFISLKNWERIETKKLSFYECGGQTVFPAYGSDGGVATSMMFYYVTMVNLINRNPRSGAVMTNVGIPTGYFGH